MNVHDNFWNIYLYIMPLKYLKCKRDSPIKIVSLSPTVSTSQYEVAILLKQTIRVFYWLPEAIISHHRWVTKDLAVKSPFSMLSLITSTVLSGTKWMTTFTRHLVLCHGFDCPSKRLFFFCMIVWCGYSVQHHTWTNVKHCMQSDHNIFIDQFMFYLHSRLWLYTTIHKVNNLKIRRRKAHCHWGGKA